MKPYFALKLLAALFFCATSVGAQSLNEQFDAVPTGSQSVTPTGWFTQNNSTTVGTTGWFNGNTTVFAPQSGVGYVAANFNNTTGASTISNWLVSPAVTVENGAVLTFYTRTVTGTTYPDRLEVRLNTTNTTNVGTGPTDVGDFTTMLVQVNPTLAASGYPEVWTLYTVNLSGLSGTTTGRFAFRYHVTNGGPSGTNSDYIGIDNVVYTAPSAGINITTTSLPGGSVGVAYSTTVTALGGTPASYQWSATGLPSPLTININTGQITGTPTGTFSGNVNIAVDDGTFSDNVNLNLTIVAPATVPWTADFEGGTPLAGWTVTGQVGGWHATTNHPYAGTTALAYCQNETQPSATPDGDYAFGAVANSGTVISPLIAIPAGTTTLEYRLYVNTENSSSYDRLSAGISVNGTSFATTFYTHVFNQGYTLMSHDISAYAGQNVYIMFNFDTVDGAANNYFGIRIDDVEVSQPGSPEIDVYDAPTGGTSVATPVSVTGLTVGTTATTYTYRIENTGTDDLVLGTPALTVNSFTGPVNVSLTQPGVSTITVGNNTTFSISLTATGIGAFTATVHLASNDADESTYVFNFSGNASNNNAPRANPGTGTPAFTGTADAGPFGFSADPGASITTSLLVDDVDAHDVQVVLITPSTAQAGITAVASAAGFGASRTVDFTGTLDANAAPGVYTWTIDIEDNQTPAGTRSITVNITLNNVAPVGTNTAIVPTTGTGVDSPNAYARSFTQTTTVPSTDLFDVTDANLGQTLSIFSQTRTGGTGTTFPFNGQFAITGSAGSFTVSVSTTGALIGTDVGTHEYELVIEDVAAGNQITVFVTLTVTAQTAPTFTPGTSVSIAQGTSQTGVVVGTAADGQDPFSALNVAATNVPTGVTVSAISVNATNGEVTATITVGTGSTAGTALIEFTVTDSLSATGSDDYSFTIVANTLPVITAGSSVTMGTSASLTNRIIADVSDAEDAAGTLTVSVVTAPAGVAISAIVNTAGEVRATITTTAATVGANVVVLQVADSNGATATANFTVNVSTGGGGGGGGGGSDGGGGGCAASGGSSSLWLALFGLMAVAAMALRVRRSRA